MEPENSATKKEDSGHQLIFDRSSQYLSPAFNFVVALSIRLLSPTWWLAENEKKKDSRGARTKGIIARNYFYLACAIFFTASLGYLLENNPAETFPICLTVAFYLFAFAVPFSRCNEILFAFILDALEKTTSPEDGGVTHKTNLTYRKRISLSLLSYIELMLNYALIYFILPREWFGDDSFNTILDAIYFSGATITTTGYGDFSPSHWIPQMLTIHEVLTGFSLIVVSFAIYAGRGSSPSNEHRNSND
ncbi:Ion channel [Thiohalospira halophila DSM 15071]|uniref:Ion channel n=1 Tax=Thiohalospira halophila DSM 15071 TaxID=1123397 RepID=A0A1I1N4K4_9GAMM|nr:potassium channel family protein [Thiohalospira halophila]SFC92591.1 Ion channel [Thiohalospira halophila DSM 15071]